MTHERTVAEIARSVRDGRTTAEHFTRSALAAAHDGERGPDPLNAFLSIADEQAMAMARSLDARRDGADLPLAGVPIALKDNLCTLDLPTTCGSRILEGYQSPFEATAVRRLREAGAVIIGKTNCDEFAMGSSTENSAWGPTLNPHDRSRVPGGSSGGSAAAVAAGIVPAALGSDTGGSVRQPAALCGIVGIKPTYGRVSRYGLVAFGSSLDQIGTFGRTVADASALLHVIAGRDARDSTCEDRPVPDLAAELDHDLHGITIGIPREYFPDALDAGVGAACRRAIERLRTAGAHIETVSLPNSALAIPAYYVIAPAEASSNLARYDGVRYGLRARGTSSTQQMYEQTRSLGFGPEVKRRIMLGTFVLSAGYHDEFYGRAQRARQRIAADFDTVFRSGVDVLFTPTTPGPAFRLGEKTEDPYLMYLSDVFTVTANLAGIPGASVPIGESGGLPVGGQVLAPWWREDLVIRVAATLERALAL